MPELLERLRASLAGRYRVERELGRGGMATVCLAEDLKHHRRVAIKVLDPDIASAIGPGRFLHEIETAARLTHPHILPLFDSGDADGLLYYVMPHVEGDTLRRKLEREKQLPLEDALRIALEVAGALDYAHAHGVVHRDIKPENILLEEGHALVADFGIARAMAQSAADTQSATQGAGARTTAGTVIGTPAYMSPEQATGSRDLDGRSDIYSLGCVLFEMLAGQPPFSGPTTESLVRQHLSAPPPPVKAIRPAVSVGLEQAITKALAKAPADRFATGSAFAAALAVAEEAPPSERHRVRATLLATAAALVVLTAVAVWQHWWPFPAPSPPPLTKKDWILVAEFDGPAGDSTVAPAVRGLVSAALDESRAVQTVTPAQIKQALAAAGKPANTRVDAELARELAYRGAVRAVVEGRISKLGKGYTIILRAVDVDTARTILTKSGTARNEDALIPAVGELAKQLRKGLGENAQALKATRGMNLIMTPSFEAYRLFREAGVMNGRMQLREAIQLYRAAINLDPQFASAWLGMTYPYYYSGYPDSAFLCLDEAFRHPDRLTEAQRRAGPEGRRAFLENDFERQLADQESTLAEDPNNVGALAYPDPLCAVGRWEEALEHVRRARSLSPFPPGNLSWGNETGILEGLGRYDEAREAAQRIRGNLKIFSLPKLELAAGRYAVVESLAIANGDDPSWVKSNPDKLLWWLAGARLGRGDGAGAARTFKEGMEIVHTNRNWRWEADYRRTWLVDAVASGGAMPLPPDPARADTSIQGVVTKGLRAVVTNDTVTARRCLEAARQRGRIQIFNERVALALLQARLEALAGRPAEAVRLLRPFDRLLTPTSASVTWTHWWLADAFEQMGQPDSATFYLERNLRIAPDDRDGAVRPYVHRRLALLYAGLGRVPEAERHLATVEQAWDQPDEMTRRMLEEARAALASARAKARRQGLRD